MMGEHFFFAIKYLPAEVDCGLLAGRCIGTLHGFNQVHHDAQIGVTFPSWRDTALGRTIAFVGTNYAQLDRFRQRSYFQVMQTDGLFALTPVQEVPEPCPKVRFIRNQNLAKLFVGRRRRQLARAKRRAEERGDVFQPHAPAQAREVGIFHSVFLQSASNGQHFVLLIQKQQIEKGEQQIRGGFNSYGLASNMRHTGQVPELGSFLRDFF